MNVKAEKFSKYLVEKEITCFQAQEITEAEMHPVAFRSFMEVNGQNLPTMLVIDDSIYVMLQVRVAGAVVKENNKAAVLERLNKLNESFKVFKYYVNEGGDIVIESCMPAGDAEFAPELVHAVIDVVLRHLNEEYSNLMKIVWEN